MKEELIVKGVEYYFAQIEDTSGRLSASREVSRSMVEKVVAWHMKKSWAGAYQKLDTTVTKLMENAEDESAREVAEEETTLSHEVCAVLDGCFRKASGVSRKEAVVGDDESGFLAHLVRIYDDYKRLLGRSESSLKALDELVVQRLFEDFHAGVEEIARSSFDALAGKEPEELEGMRQ